MPNLMFRRNHRWMIVAGATILTLAGLSVAAPANASVASERPGSGVSKATALNDPSVPLPSADPFYAVPANVGQSTPGAVLASRPVSIPLLSALGAGAAYQLKYRTTEDTDVPTAAVETILTPLLPWLGKGKRPVVYDLLAYDALGEQCDPSYTLRASVIPDVSNAPITAWLAQGWDVAIPDYEGPNVTLYAPTITADAVLDAARATAGFAPTGVTLANPIAITGYSGGGFATALAAQAQPTYAPELNLQAAVMGGVPADWNAALANLSGGLFSYLIPFYIAGLQKTFPTTNLQQYVTPAIWADVQAESSDCITDPNSPAFTSLAQMEAYPGSLTSGPFAQLTESVAAVNLPGNPTAPVYDYHALNDEVSSLSADEQLMRRYCAAGTTVDFAEVPGEHLTGGTTGAPGALLYLELRFAGVAPANNCASIPAS